MCSDCRKESRIDSDFFFEKFIRVRIYVFFFFFFGLSLNGSVNSGYKVSLYYFVMNVSRQCLLARG